MNEPSATGADVVPMHTCLPARETTMLKLPRQSESGTYGCMYASNVRDARIFEEATFFKAGRDGLLKVLLRG
jgi:hypothetical protein